MKNSSIQWTDHTWNIAVGCKKVDEDCKFCYMYRDSMDGTRYDPKQIRRTKTVFNTPLKIKEPARIFTSSLTDVFLPEIDGFRDEMWEIIRKCPQHQFQILTKRPERIADHLPPDWGQGWPNVWLGTSVGSNESMPRIYELFKVPSRIRFVSFEPLHGRVDLETVNHVGSDYEFLPFDWAIIGGESGNDTGKYRYRPCEEDWILSIMGICADYRVPVFVKQLGTHLAKQMGLKDRHGGNLNEWPNYFQIRQFPDV